MAQDKKLAKPLKPTRLPPMHDIPPERQEELSQRYHTRGDIREANKQLASLLKGWVHDIVLDRERFKGFHASGHQGEYQEFPKDSLVRQLIDLGWTPEQLKKLPPSATPLDLMSVEELRFVLQRIQLMLDWFQSHPSGGTYARACNMYEAIGIVVRNVVEK